MRKATIDRILDTPNSAMWWPDPADLFAHGMITHMAKGARLYDGNRWREALP